MSDIKKFLQISLQAFPPYCLDDTSCDVLIVMAASRTNYDGAELNT